MENNSEDIVENWGLETMLEIILNDPSDFLKVKETLTRIGIASKNNILYQSCHILHKKGRYFIVHFKEMFMLDGKQSTLSYGDIEKRNTIATLLEDWGLVEIVNSRNFRDKSSLKQIKVVAFKDKKDWRFVSKYDIGN